MRISLVIAGTLPGPGQNGSAVLTWTAVRHLLQVGHDVRVLGLVDPHDLGQNRRGLDEHREALERAGVEVQLVPSRSTEVVAALQTNLGSRIKRQWKPTPEELFPHLVDGEVVLQLLSEAQPDAVWAYHWEGVAATRRLQGLVPRLATVVDLPHLSALYRWRASAHRLDAPGIARLGWLQARLREQPRLLVRLLNECETSANFAAHHAEWLRRRGAKRCAYLRTPVPDPVGADWQRAREAAAKRKVPTLILVGHMRGVSTIAGLELFAKDVLPRLERALGAEGFEVRVVGAHDPPAELRKRLERPAVRLVGYVPDIAEEFLAADMLVVPTPIRLGTRVRILTAFSHGCPVVAHATNALGIPELEHGQNALLASSGAGLAAAIVRLAQQPDLRLRLERGGRRTYEQHFAPDRAARVLEDVLRSIVPEPALHSPSRRKSAI